jgi:hypothetical protein
MAFTELRIYEVFEGKMDDWIKLMEEEIIPFQTELGLKITSRYRGEMDDSLYVWMRDFDSEEQRKAQYEAVYESERWKTDIGPRVRQLINVETMKVERLVGV